MAIEQNSQLGVGGTGMHGAGQGSAARMLRELQGLRVSIVAGGSANTKLALSTIRDTDTIISALNNNAGTITDVTGTISIDDLRAVGTVTVGTAAANDTVTVAGSVYILVPAIEKVEQFDYTKVKVGATAAETAANLAAAINKREGNRSASQVIATAASNVVTVRAVAEGTSGNSITLAEVGSSFTVSGATLAGGSATGGIRSTGATNSVILFWLEKP
jgi:phage tail sheath gpL-like